MNQTLLLLLSLALLLGPVATPTPKQVQVGQVFSLHIGEEVQLTDSLSGLSTTLKLNALSDNRCPTYVRCIQAGDVTIIIETSNAGTDLSSRKIQLSKTAAFYVEGDIASEYNPSTTLAPGYELVLLQALPYPEVKSGKRATTVQLRVQPIKTN